MTVVPMVFGSALCMIIFSLLTRPPGQATIDKYFSKTEDSVRRHFTIERCNDSTM